MDAVFLKLFNMSITASWLILAVIALRLLLKRSPKWMRCALWALVAVRLICPFSIESVLSLVPSSEPLPERVISGPSFDVNTGIAPVDNTVNDYLCSHYFEGVTVPTGNGSSIMAVLGIVWLIGVALLLTYTCVSFIRVRRQVREAVTHEENIMLCDRIATPFILGIFRPRIYLPSSMNEADMEYVIAHEKAHLKRHDHLWKPLGFILLAVYWFNPLIWTAYVLLCRDIELACDEKVIKALGEENKRSYSTALLNCSAPRRTLAACPLAFGEVGVKKRIKAVLNYKKPAFWVIIIAAIVCIASAVCFLTDPKGSSDRSAAVQADAELTGLYTVSKNIYEDNSFSSYIDIEPYYFVNNNVLTWSVVGEAETNENKMTDLGALSTLTLDKENFDSYFKNTEVWVGGMNPEKLRQNNVKAWSVVCKWNYNLFFYLLRQENGDFYLCRGFAEDGRTIRAVQKLIPDDGFKATVTEVERSQDGQTDAAIFVKPFEDEELSKSGDSFRIDRSLYSFYTPDFEVGDEVWIGCDGSIREVYPPELASVNGIFKLSDNAKKADETVNPTFNATVVEVYEKTIRVKPFAGEPIDEGEIMVGTSVMSETDRARLQAGTTVQVVYDGTILSTYPAQLGKEFAVYILEEIE